MKLKEHDYLEAPLDGNQFKPLPGFRLFYKGGGNDVKETEDQKELAKIGLDQWNQYQATYPEVEQEFFDDVDRFNTDSYRQRGADQAATSVGSAFSEAANNQIDELGARGVNPNSGAFNGAINNLETSESASRVGTANQTQQGIQDSFLQGKANIVAMGSGQESEAIQGFGNIAAESGQKAIQDAQINYSKDANRRSALAAGAGAFTSAFVGNEKKEKE